MIVATGALEPTACSPATTSPGGCARRRTPADHGVAPGARAVVVANTEDGSESAAALRGPVEVIEVRGRAVRPRSKHVTRSRC